MSLVPPYFYVTGTVKMIVQAETAFEGVYRATSGITIETGRNDIKTLSADTNDFTAEGIKEQCPCFSPDTEHDPETGADTCACGHALDEHDETGQCTVELG